jgi:hypothetical protein
MNLETQIRRFEQQLNSFEKLHSDELKKFEEKLATYLRLQADEVKFLREELAALKKELARYEASETALQGQNGPTTGPTPKVGVSLTRREFLGGADQPGQS